MVSLRSVDQSERLQIEQKLQRMIIRKDWISIHLSLSLNNMLYIYIESTELKERNVKKKKK